MRASTHIAWFVVAVLYCVTSAADEHISTAPPGATAEPKPTDQIDNPGPEPWWEAYPLAGDNPPASSVPLDAAKPGFLEKFNAMEPEKKNATLLSLARAMLENQDFEQGEAILRSLAERNYAPAQTRLGLMYAAGEGVPENLTEAVHWFHLAANQGDQFSLELLGAMYANGYGVEQDRDEAVRLFTLQANGDASVLAQTAISYDVGGEDDPDYIMAAKLYRVAAEMGDSQAQFNLALLYEAGKGVNRDQSEAIHLYRQAANQGNASAQYNLGVKYAKGEGIPQDYREAVRWYRLAANQGDGLAQNNLGYMYSQGHGILQDYVQAHMWYNLAAAQGGSNLAAKNRDGIARKMTPSQLAEAQRLARDWTSNAWDVVSETTVPQEPKLTGSGTGFFISSKGHVLTNHHVVDGCREVLAGTSAEGYQAAQILTANARSDLAILQTGDVSKRPARFRTSPSVRQGENSAVFGFPLAGALSSTGNLTTGNITALAGLDDDPGFFQISTPVQPGNSGGPLLDMSGAVVGVVVSKLDAIKVASAIQDIPQNVNFAIKGSVVLNLLESRGIPYESAAATATRSAADVADIARGFTVQVLCYQ